MHNRIFVFQGKPDAGIQTISECMDIQTSLRDLTIVFFNNGFCQIRKVAEIVVKGVSVNAAFQNDILYCDFCKWTFIKKQNKGGFYFIAGVDCHLQAPFL